MRLPLIWCTLVPVLASAQSVPTIKLAAPEVMFEEAFTMIAGLRELPDGTVLVADPREPALKALDPVSRTARRIGTVGRGPREYARPFGVLAISAESTIVIDPPNGRLLVLIGTDAVGTLPPDSPAARLGRSGIFGFDLSGHMLTAQNIGERAPGSQLPTDSSRLLVVDRGTGATQPVGAITRLPLVVKTFPGATPGAPPRTGATIVPFMTSDQPIMFPDGWIAVARVDPYRIDWRRPDGAWVWGARLPTRSYPVTAAEKQAYVERNAQRFGQPVQDPATFPKWPDHLPAFTNDAVVTLPNGQLLVARMQPHDAATAEYDIVDRTGALAGHLILNANERVVASGAGSIYAAVTDRDGFLRIQKHKWGTVVSPEFRVESFR